MLNRSILKTG